MPYKLMYFNVRARAETSRMLMEMAGVEYEDARIEQAQWPDVKPSTMFGQLPQLEVDGKTYCQSHTIERFLARRFNLYGKDEFEQTQSDMIVDCLEDFLKPLLKMFSASEEAKVKMRKDFTDETMPKMLPQFERLVSSGGCFLGNQVMWPDIAFYNVCGWPPYFGVEFDLSKYPKLKALHAKVESHPKIAAWLKKRPDNSL